MPIIPLKPMMDYAKKAKIAHGAYNVNMIAQAEAVIEAHTILNSGVIIQGADLANAFMGGRADFMNGTLEDKKLGAKRIADAVHQLAKNTHIPIVLHLDHGRNYESCVAAIDAGYSSVMIDGSSLSFEENVALTKKVVDYAHPLGVSVEGELGVLAGVEDDVFSEQSTYTNPVKVCEFVKATGVDALAISYGTKHGASKGTNVKLRKEIVIASLENLHHEGLDVAIVSHGSSMVPQYLVDDINNLGGNIKGTGGVPVSELLQAIPCGVSKINVDTDIRLAVTRNLRRWLLDNPSLQQEKGLKEMWQIMTENPNYFDPRQYILPFMQQLIKGEEIDAPWSKEFIAQIKRGVMESTMTATMAFGSVGDADKINDLAKQYKEN